MLNAREQSRLYQFSHDIGRPSWEVETTTFLLNVVYPDASAAMTEGLAGEKLILRNVHSNISVEHRFYPYTVSTTVMYGAATEPLAIDLDFSAPVDVQERSEGMLVISDASGHEMMTLIPSRPKDDTGMMGPAPTVSVTGEGGTRRVELSIDPEWLGDTARVFPVLLPVDYSLTPPDEAVRSVRMMAIADQTVLYRDTRPDSATQFHVEFFDDYEFVRLRPEFEGKPACSTVPTVLPNTVVTASTNQTSIIQEDVTRFEDGNGYDSRTVWLRFIASKDISAATQVIYDIDTPGTTDYTNNVAERIGDMDGLPMFRGSFELDKANPPSSQDGLGRIHVYIHEKRVKDLGVRLTISAKRWENREASATVLFGKAGVYPLFGHIEVMSFPRLFGKINVVGRKGLESKDASINVIQLTPPGVIVPDPNFRTTTSFNANWHTPVVYPEFLFWDGYTSGTMTWQSDGRVLARMNYRSSYNPFLPESPSTLSLVPGEMTNLAVPIFDVRIATGLFIRIANRIDEITAGEGYEWANSTSPYLPVLTMTISGLGSGSDELTVTIPSSQHSWTYGSTYINGEFAKTYSCTISPSLLVADDPSTINISSLAYKSGYTYGYRRMTAYPFTVDTWPSSQQSWLLRQLSVAVVTP